MHVVLCSCPPDVARDIADRLVHDRLAACVSIVPGVESVYVWEGKVERAAEVLLWIKVAADDVQALCRALVERHPYQVPEIVVFPVDTEISHGPYVSWVRAAGAR